MTTRQQRAIDDFSGGRISVDELNVALCADIAADPDAVFDAVKDALCAGDDAPIRERDIVPTLIALLRAGGHYQHEDLARWLQDLRDPRAVDALYEVALTKHEYLAFNNSYALARKCTWALADIGTREAREKLRLLAGGDDPEIAGYAQKRLDSWDEELGRKGPRAR
jgi:hypothetical protein